MTQEGQRMDTYTLKVHYVSTQGVQITYLESTLLSVQIQEREKPIVRLSKLAVLSTHNHLPA